LNQVLVYQAISLVKALLLGGELYAKAFHDAGGIPIISELITFDSDHVKYEACRVLANHFREGWFVDELLKKSVGALSVLLNSKFDVLKQEGALALSAVLKSNGSLGTHFATDQTFEGICSVVSTYNTQSASSSSSSTATLPTQHTALPEPERITTETVRAALTALKAILTSTTSSTSPIPPAIPDRDKLKMELTKLKSHVSASDEILFGLAKEVLEML